MRVCYNVTESVNDVSYRQRISYSESISLLVKIHCKGNSIKLKAYNSEIITVRKFHQSKDL